MKKEVFEYRIEIFRKGCVISSEDAIVLAFIVEGEGSITIGGESRELHQADVVLVNHNESASVQIVNGIFVLVYINYFQLCDFLGQSILHFTVDSTEDDDSGRYKKLRKKLQKLLIAYVGRGRDSIIAERGHLYLLADCLIHNFEDTKMVISDMTDTDSQVLRIIHYIEANYESSLSLNDIAEKLYLSPSWASRVFQKEIGVGFAAYVKNLRLKKAKRILETTQEPITQIAMDMGFSTPSAFNRIFKNEYAMTPTEYRKTYYHKYDEKILDLQKTKEYLEQLLKKNREMDLDNISRSKVVHADVSRMVIWKRWKNCVLNVGPLEALSSADLREQVLFLVDTLNIEYIRVWNVFSAKLMLYDSKTGEYNFTFIDDILDFCVDNRLLMFFDMAQRRNVVLAGEDKEIYSMEASEPFGSEDEWISVIYGFLSHIRTRYHDKVVEDWVFEFSFFLNENPYYLSGRYSTREVWEKGYETVKAVIPHAKVAGPGMIGHSDYEYLKMIAEYFLSSKYRPDIFTSMHFPYTVDGTLRNSTIYQKKYTKVANFDFLYEEAGYIRKVLKEKEFQGEYWVTDWGNSLGNRNYIQDSCFRAAFIVDNALRCHGEAETFGLFYASDIISLFADSKAILSGSAGLLSRNGIGKPAYFAYQFLSRLGRYLILKNDQCIITAENSGDIQILCCNYKPLGARYYLSAENTYRPEKLDELFEDLEPDHLEFSIRLEDENLDYTVRQKILNKYQGSVLDKWVDFGCATELRRSDMSYLKNTSIPEIISEKITANGNMLHLNIRMEPNEIRMISILRN